MRLHISPREIRDVIKLNNSELVLSAGRFVRWTSVQSTNFRFEAFVKLIYYNLPSVCLQNFSAPTTNQAV
jgi:hypothetical protein